MAIYLAAWLQQADIESTQHLIMIFIGILAISIALVAIVGTVALLGLLKAAKSITSTVSDLRDKANPVIQEIGAISRHTREVLEDAKPKIATITGHLARTSATVSETAVVAKSAVQKFEATVSDANARTQRQVARVDGMVSAALNTTAEVVEAVNHGIRVPAQKIAQAAGQAKIVAEGLLDRIKGMAGSMPFVGHKQPKPGAYPGAAGSSGSRYRATPAASDAPSSSAGTTYAASSKDF